MTGLALTTLALVLAGAAEPQPSAVLSLRLGGFRSDAGQVLVAVHRGADGFPGAKDRAYATAVATVTSGRASVDIALPPGEYAVAIVHDENNNGALDTSWLGIPQEGFGVSNNATRRFGAPRYREAKFSLPARGAVQRITVVYL